jgi:hypothetical protein
MNNRVPVISRNTLPFFSPDPTQVSLCNLFLCKGLQNGPGGGQVWDFLNTLYSQGLAISQDNWNNLDVRVGMEGEGIAAGNEAF